MLCNGVYNIVLYLTNEVGGAVIFLLISAQYLSGMPASLSSESFLCFTSSNLLRLLEKREQKLKINNNYYLSYLSLASLSSLIPSLKYSFLSFLNSSSLI